MAKPERQRTAWADCGCAGGICLCATKEAGETSDEKRREIVSELNYLAGATRCSPMNDDDWKFMPMKAFF